MLNAGTKVFGIYLALDELSCVFLDVYSALSLVQLLHCCALIGRELLSVEIFSCTERSYYRRQ